MAFVDIVSPFVLRLEDGTTVSFVAGPQHVEDALLSHWFVASHIRGSERRIAPGSPEYALQMQTIEGKIQAEKDAHAQRIAELESLRTAGQRQEVQNAIAGMRPGDVSEDDLTPAQRSLRDAARRQANRTRTSIGEFAPVAEPPPPGGESHNHGAGRLRDANEGIPYTPAAPMPGGEHTQNRSPNMPTPQHLPGSTEGGTESKNPADGSGQDDTGGIPPDQQGQDGAPRRTRPALRT